MSEAPRPTTPGSAGGDGSRGNSRSTSLTQTHPHGRARRRHMKRTRSAPDCKHGVASKIKVGVCAMDKKAKSKPMSEILARLTAGGEFEVITFGDQVILNDDVESWPLCDVLLSWHSEGFPLRKAQAYVELRRPFLINDVHSQDLLLDRRRVYKTLTEHNIPIPRHILVNREPAPAPEPSSDPPVDIDELTTSSSSAGSSPRAGGPKTSKAGKQPFKEGAPAAPADSSTAAIAAAAAAPAAAAGAAAEEGQPAAAGEGSPAAAAGAAEEVLLDPPGFVEEEDYVELDGMRIDKPFVEKPVSGEDHNIHIYYPHSMGGGVKRLFRKVDNKSADYDPHHPGTVRRDGSYIYEEFLTTGGTDVKVYTVGPRYAHAEARKSPVVDGKVNRTPDGKEVRFPVLLSPQEKEIARMVCLAFGQRVCGFDLLRSETGRSYVCDVNGWSFVKNSKKYYDDAAGILRVMILSQLAPQRLTVAPEAPMPLAGLLEEAAAAQAAGAAGDAQPGKGPQSAADSEDGSGGGLKFREPSISAAAQPAELGWEEQPSALAAGDVDGEVGGLKEVSSLQDLTSLDGTYEEEGMGTDDSSSTAGVVASDVHRNLELRCVLAVVRHGDRTPKQKMKVTVTQAPLIALYNKYKDSKGKQAKLKSPGQLQELLDVVRALLAEMEAKSSSQRSSRSSTPAPGSQLREEEKAQEQHEELREKLRIVRTVLEQGGTFAGINRKVQLKPTKWSTASSCSSKPQAVDPADQHAQQSIGEQQAQPQQQQATGQGGKAPHGDGVRSARTSSTGGAAPAVAGGPADGKPHVTELLLILKYGGVLTHAGRAQAEELGKTFRMVMYPRYGPAGGGGFLRLHSTYRHDLKIYSSDEGRVQMSAAAFIKGLLDLEGSSLTPILVSLVTKNASMLDAFGKGASDDILNAKNTLYQHLTWDPDKAVSLCSKLALPLATPAVGVTPPVSPKSTTAEEIMSPFHAGPQRSSHAGLEAGGSGNLPASNTTSGVSTPTAAAAAAHHSSSFGHEVSIPTSGSCLDLLQQGRAGSGPRRTRASGTGSTTGEQPQQQQQPPPQQQQQGSITPRGGGGSSGSLVAAATANAAGLHTASGLSKLAHSSSWGAVRAAEARAAALSGIKAMPEKPLVLLYQLVELMKVLVDQLREKCLEERVESVNPLHQPQQEKPAEAAGDKAAGDKAVVAAGGEKGGQSLPAASSTRGISSSRYSSLASSPDDWRLDDSKPCSGERLLLMFDRWRKLLKSFYSEKKQQFDISKVPDIYDSAKYDAIHNSHLQLSSLGDLYRISRQLAAVVVPHEYGLDEQGKLLIGSKICSELLGKLLIDLESMKEESIVTAAIEARTAAARSEEAAGSGSRHPSRQRVASHSSFLDNSFDAFESEFGHMSVLDGRMRPPKPPGAPSSSKLDKGAGQGSGWAGGGGDAQAAGQAGGGAVGADGQQQQQQEGEEQQEDQQEQEQEILHRLCPTYASDINSPLRHVRTRIYFTSESHIHSLVNVLRYCHLIPSSSSSALGSYGTAASSISKAPSAVSVPGVAAAAATAGGSAAAAAAGGSGAAAAAAAGGSGAAAAVAASGSGAGAAAAAVQPATDGAAEPAAVTAAAVSSSSDTAPAAAAAVVGADAASGAPAAAAAASIAKAKGTAFASPAAAAVAAAGGAAAVTDGSSSGEALAGTSSVSSTTGPQQLLTPEGQTLLAGTDEFDYLTHIVFRMYENKTAPVDAPERFFVEIQFSNGANYDPTLVEPPRHTMPTQPRRLLTPSPGVPLQSFQELTAKYTRGKIAPCNYQLQYALRAPGIGSMALSKAPTPGMSRANSTNLGPPAPSPGLPPMPPPASAVPSAATSLLAAGPGAAPSAPLPLPASVAAAAAAAVERKQS